jgi:hypothetical protein
MVMAEVTERQAYPRRDKAVDMSGHALARQGKLGRTLLDLDRALRQFFRVDGFGETAEMAREEIFGNCTEGYIVLRPRETMAFIGK